MKRNPCELALVVVSLVCAITLAACSSGSKVLRYITISPTSASISVPTTQQFTATGYYSDGSSVQNLAAAWLSSNTNVATINSSSGVATAVASGTTMITATLSGVTSSAATLSVNQLTSIAVTPANQTIAINATEQYKATGTFTSSTGSTTSDITAQVTWSAATATIATFSTTTPGLATGVGAGTTAINAVLDGVTGTTNLTVGNGPVSLVVSPATATIAINNSTAFTVQEKWSDGSMHAPSGTVTWSSSSTAQAGVVSNGAAAALAAGFAAGAPTITATEGTLTGTAALTVVTGSTHYAYISNNGDTPPTLGFYTVTAPTSPYLTPGTPATVTVPNNSSQQTILNPNGKYLYTVDNLGGVWLWNIATGTGVLTFAGTPSQPGSGGLDIDFGIIDPYGRFLYVADSGNTSPVVPSSIYAYAISQTDGTLTPVTNSPFTTNLNTPYGLVIDHSGQYLYATNNGSNSVSAYQIDQATGALTPLSTGAVTTTGINAPFFAALDPTGADLYVANNGDNSVASFSIGTGGVLTSLGANLTVTGASSIFNLAVTPNGQVLYVLDNGSTGNGQVFGFALTSGVPATTPISGTPIATGLAPIGMAIDPTGVLLAVDNSNPQTTPAPGSISLFTIGAGGTLTSDTPVAAGINCEHVTFYDAP